MKGGHVKGCLWERTFLENLGPVDSDEPRVGVLVFLAVAHDGRLYGNL